MATKIKSILGVIVGLLASFFVGPSSASAENRLVKNDRQRVMDPEEGVSRLVTPRRNNELEGIAKLKMPKENELEGVAKLKMPKENEKVLVLPEELEITVIEKFKKSDHNNMPVLVIEEDGNGYIRIPVVSDYESEDELLELYHQRNNE